MKALVSLAVLLASGYLALRLLVDRIVPLQELMRVLITLVVLLGGGYLGLRWFANRVMFLPAIRYPQGLWKMQKEMGAVEIWLTARDGVRINAWWIEVPGARLATVFFHGNGGNLSYYVDHMRGIAAAGSSLLIPDYHGYGKSGGEPSQAGLYLDADAAYRWVIEQGHTPDRIVIQGQSLGSAVAVDLAAREECAGVVLESPFNSASRVAAHILPYVGPVVMRSFDSKRKIGGIRAPLLIMHGDRDEMIPYELGKDLYEAAPEPKSFWTVAGAGHNNLLRVAGQQYRERLSDFYKSLGVRMESSQ